MLMIFMIFVVLAAMDTRIACSLEKVMNNVGMALRRGRYCLKKCSAAS